jgi:hypothetical protein
MTTPVLSADGLQALSSVDARQTLNNDVWLVWLERRGGVWRVKDEIVTAMVD